MTDRCLKCRYGSRRKGAVVCCAPHIIKAAHELGFTGKYVEVRHLKIDHCPDFSPAS